MDEIKNLVAYVFNELNQVCISGGANITHMDIALQGLDRVMQKLNELSSEKKPEDDKPTEKDKVTDKQQKEKK